MRCCGADILKSAFGSFSARICSAPFARSPSERVSDIMRGMARFLFCLVMLFAAAAQEREIATAVSFTEGPTVDRDGNVYFSEIMTERIMKLSTDGVLSTYREH